MTETLDDSIAQKEHSQDETSPDKPLFKVKTKRKESYLFSCTLFVFVACATYFASHHVLFWIESFFLSIALGLLTSSSIHIALTWERVIILRFGRFSRIVEPGLYFTIPIVEQIAIRVDQRINTTPFLNEHALTSDLAPVDVDAVVFWMVWDAKQAYTQVSEYKSAVAWSAQTALRDAIGHINLTDVPMRRQQIDHEIQEALERKVSDWGISIISVEIRDISMPDSLQSAMSQAAQAERERDARIILAEAEKEVSHMFVEAAQTYKENDIALHLRTTNLLYEGVKDNSGLVIVPSSFSESINTLEKMTESLKH